MGYFYLINILNTQCLIVVKEITVLNYSVFPFIVSKCPQPNVSRKLQLKRLAIKMAIKMAIKEKSLKYFL